MRGWSRLAVVLWIGCGVAGAQMVGGSVAPAAYPSGDRTELGARILGLLSDPGVARAHWGISVVGLGGGMGGGLDAAMEGTPIWGLDEGKLFRPASTAKLFTTSAAMALLGPEKTFETRVYGTLKQDTGVVQGDLILVGGGDPSFGTHDLPFVPLAPPGKQQRRMTGLNDLEGLADQVVAKGVREISGDVVGSDSLFPWEPYPESWAADDLVWGYGAPVSALSVGDNQLRLTVTPGVLSGGAVQAPAVVALDQFGVGYDTVKADVATVAKGGAQGIQVERDPATRTLRVYGQLAEGAAADVEWVAIDDPAAFAAMALRDMLVRRGVAVEGSSTRRHRWPSMAGSFMAEVRAPGKCETLTMDGGECGGSCGVATQTGTMLASHTSAPMAEDVLYTLKESENLHAELFLHHLGRRVFCGQGSTVAGERMLNAFVAHAGIDAADLALFDGSGLSDKDEVTPRAEAQLLVFASTQPWFAAWKAGLPVGGVDGTLKGRFTEAPLKGKVFAKTGTLGESRALAGYVVCKSGREVAFSILVDDHAPGSSADRVVMDKIVAAIAEME